MRRSSGSDVWREVPDFPDYKINKKGDIYNKRIDKVISASPKSKNCSAVNLRKNGKNYLLGAYESEKDAQEEFERVNALIGAGHLNITLGS